MFLSYMAILRVFSVFMQWGMILGYSVVAYCNANTVNLLIFCYPIELIYSVPLKSTNPY